MDRQPSPDPSLPSMRASVPFIGRRPEVDCLKETLAAAVAGSPRILLIAGEAGMGKTRLLRELRPAFENAATVLLGRCYEGSTVSYWPFVQMVHTCLNSYADKLRELSAGDRAVIERLAGKSVASAPQELPSGGDR